MGTELICLSTPLSSVCSTHAPWILFSCRCSIQGRTALKRHPQWAQKFVFVENTRVFPQRGHDLSLSARVKLGRNLQLNQDKISGWIRARNPADSGQDIRLVSTPSPISVLKVWNWFHQVSVTAFLWRERRKKPQECVGRNRKRITPLAESRIKVHCSITFLASSLIVPFCS